MHNNTPDVERLVRTSLEKLGYPTRVEPRSRYEQEFTSLVIRCDGINPHEHTTPQIYHENRSAILAKPHIYEELDPAKAVKKALDDLGYPGHNYVPLETYVRTFVSLTAHRLWKKAFSEKNRV